MTIPQASTAAKIEITTCRLHKTAAHDMLVCPLCNLTTRRPRQQTHASLITPKPATNGISGAALLQDSREQCIDESDRHKEPKRTPSLASLIEHKNSTKQQLQRRLATQLFSRRVSAIKRSVYPIRDRRLSKQESRDSRSAHSL